MSAALSLGWLEINSVAVTTKVAQLLDGIEESGMDGVNFVSLCLLPSLL